MEYLKTNLLLLFLFIVQLTPAQNKTAYVLKGDQGSIHVKDGDHFIFSGLFAYSKKDTIIYVPRTFEDHQNLVFYNSSLTDSINFSVGLNEVHYFNFKTYPDSHTKTIRIDTNKDLKSSNVYSPYFNGWTFNAPLSQQMYYEVIKDTNNVTIAEHLYPLTVPISYKNNRLYIEAQINNRDKSELFLFDTGAQGASVSNSQKIIFKDSTKLV